MKSLFEQLMDAGVPQLKSYLPGHTEKLVCPRCNGGRDRDHSLSVTISIDGTHAMWQCHRQKCDPQFKGRVDEERYRPEPKPKPKARYAGAFSRPFGEDPKLQPEFFWKFWEDRCIGIKTVEHFGVYGTKDTAFGDSLVFPYIWQRKTVNRKTRSHPKKHFRNDKDTLRTLFNADAIKAGEPLHLTEGEIDAMSMHEAGFPCSVSTRDGNQDKLEAFTTHSEILAQVPLFYLCGDMDDAGKIWLENISRRLGKHKCRIVRWPEGRKDASDTLRMSAGLSPEEYEQVSIPACVAAATRFPMEGVRDVTPEVVEEAFNRPIPPVLTVGVNSIDEHLRFPSEGKVIVVTGVPTHGKTTLLRFIAVRTIQSYERRWLALIQESEFYEYVVECTKIFTEKPFGAISKADRRRAGIAFADGKLRVLQFDGENNPATLDAIMERAKFSVLQDGTTDLMIDPVNEIDHQTDDMISSERIGRMLQRFGAFAREYRCNVWIVVHPAKPQGYNRNDKKPPTGYDCAGSAHWANKCDLGFTVWRENGGNTNDVELHVWKSRTERWAKIEAIGRAWFDAETRRYVEALPPTDAAPEPPPEYRPWHADQDRTVN